MLFEEKEANLLEDLRLICHQEIFLVNDDEGADFILEVGSHIRFKRKLFEDYLDTASTV